MPQVTCDHCQAVNEIRLMYPVMVEGVQSYLGHLITNRPGIRRVFLCVNCYLNFHDASTTIGGMSIRDDLEALEILRGTDGVS